MIKWIKKTDFGTVRFMCDNCKHYQTLATNYCSNCGSQMDVIKSKKYRYNKNNNKLEKVNE